MSKPVDPKDCDWCNPVARIDDDTMRRLKPIYRFRCAKCESLMVAPCFTNIDGTQHIPESFFRKDYEGELEKKKV